MGQTVIVEKLLEFRDAAHGCTLINVCIDFDGNPVMLFEEGREPFPRGGGETAIRRWYKTVASAHRAIRYADGALTMIRITNTSNSISTTFAQGFGNEWLLADSRGGNARFYSEDGSFIRSIGVGDAINDLQTTCDGLIWVSYFDEGVFGGGIGANGLVCFAGDGEVRFGYAQLAEEVGLPHIDDCYALNVCPDRVWASYYSAFPLICLRDFQLATRLEPRVSCKAFAIRDRNLICISKNLLLNVQLDTGKIEELDVIDSSGVPLKNFQNGSFAYFASNQDMLPYYEAFQSAGRGAELFVWTDDALYRVP
jgi:hypothetical protein